MTERFTLVDRDDALNFHVGEGIYSAPLPPAWRAPDVVSAIDHAEGTIVLRSPTRGESVRWVLAWPFRWVSYHWRRWRWSRP